MSQKRTIAQVLKASGLFWGGKTINCKCITGMVNYSKKHPHGELCPVCDGAQKLPWPTADQSEAILARMGLQAMRSGEKTYLVKTLLRLGGVVDWVRVKVAQYKYDLVELEGETLTHRLNHALAWATKNMPTELEAAVKGETE